MVTEKGIAIENTEWSILKKEDMYEYVNSKDLLPYLVWLEICMEGCYCFSVKIPYNIDSNFTFKWCFYGIKFNSLRLRISKGK